MASSRSRHSSFKRFKDCTICLVEFEEGDAVKIVPGCDHVFHKECLDGWLLKAFKCPNCNVVIKIEETRQERIDFERRMSVIMGRRVTID